jgi:uncharacterized membrane protein
MGWTGDNWTDRGIERTVGRLLRVGVTIAAAVVLAGGAFYLVRYGTALPEYRVFRGEPAQLRGVMGVVGEVLTLHSRGVIQLGLLLLVAVPVVRVAFSALAFWRQRDYTYVVVALVVLGLLLFSMAGGRL